MKFNSAYVFPSSSSQSLFVQEIEDLDDTPFREVGDRIEVFGESEQFAEMARELGGVRKAIK